MTPYSSDYYDRGYINRGHPGAPSTTPPRRLQPSTPDMACGAAPSGPLPLPHPQRIGHRLIEASGAQFWTSIYSIDVTSNECPAKVQTLLSCRSSVNVARSLQGNDAQIFIDFLDQVSCKSSAHASATQGVNRRFLHSHASMINSGSGVYCFFPRSARPIESYPPRTFFNENAYALGGCATMVGSQT